LLTDVFRIVVHILVSFCPPIKRSLHVANS
jgi:hypothetical protein